MTSKWPLDWLKEDWRQIQGKPGVLGVHPELNAALRSDEGQRKVADALQDIKRLLSEVPEDGAILSFVFILTYETDGTGRVGRTKSAVFGPRSVVQQELAMMQQAVEEQT